MAAPVRFGQIVWAEMADANGIRKLRPAVVVTPSDRLQESGPFEVVAVTSQVPEPLPADHVLLPWHSQGHPRTGLNRKCAAVCTWLARILPPDIKGMAGVVPGQCLVEILAKVPQPQQAPKPEPPKDAETGPGTA